jgi:hypothetical protein
MTDIPTTPPSHYAHKSGLQPVHIILHHPHPLASAFEYVWRAGKKCGWREDLQKALNWLTVDAYRRNQTRFPQRIEHWLTSEGNMATVRKVDPGLRSDALHAIFDSAQDSGPEKLHQAIEAVQKFADALQAGEDYEKALPF